MNSVLQMLHVGYLHVGDVVLAADALSTGMVLSSHQPVAGRTLLQSWQHVKDSPLAIVEQEDAQVATQVLVPQGVLVVEETEDGRGTRRTRIHE